MPKSKKPSSPRSKAPRNGLFAGIILIGVVVLIVLWLREQPAPPNTKAKPLPALSNTQKPMVQPILTLSKTNQSSNATNLSPVVITKNPATSKPPSALTNPPAATNPPAVTNPVPVSRNTDRFAQTVLEAQVALTRLGISAGSIDGTIGSQTRSALRAFQRSERLPVTGELDAATKARLPLAAPLFTSYTVTAEDLAGLRPLGAGWMSKSQQSALAYENILELVAEKSHSHPGYIKQLNPGIDWQNVSAGKAVRVPNVESTKPIGKAAMIQIRLAEKTLEAFDANMNLLAHFPCSIAQRIEKRPVGELRVEVIAENPDYTFDPDIFPESPEARQIATKLILAPGPNNPVGTVWIGLDKPGYGIHGSPKPEDVGRTESHGCFRLANWNAEYLLRLVSVGTPVHVEP